MSERCERTSERRSEWPSTRRVDCLVILPNVDSSDTVSIPGVNGNQSMRDDSILDGGTWALL